MSDSTTASTSSTVWNIPNQLTLARIVLALALFVFLPFGWYKTSIVLFVFTVATDWLDGYWARKYQQITQFGRVVDPFADKLLICGTFILLSAIPPLSDGTWPSGIAAWMAVIVTGRELLVTALRTFVESHGGDFSAKWVGKWKMALQCLSALGSMVHLTYVDLATNSWHSIPPAWLSHGLTVVVWAMVLLTLYSGVSYVKASIEKFRKV